MNEAANISPGFHITVSKMAGDMNFVGIFYIIIGAIECLTIIGAVIGIPLIICGLRLRESSDSFKGYLASGDSFMLERALERESRFFFIQKVLMIIAIVFLVLYIVGIIIFGLSIMSNFQSFRTV
jgi:hypothetical protein